MSAFWVAFVSAIFVNQVGRTVYFAFSIFESFPSAYIAVDDYLVVELPAVSVLQ